MTSLGRPHAIQYTLEEGGKWLNFGAVGYEIPRAVNAIKFDDGSEWDVVGGWRKGTIPYLGRWFEGYYTVTKDGMNRLQQSLLKHIDKENPAWEAIMAVLGFSPPGPTPTTSTPSAAPPSESATATDTTSLDPAVATLLEAAIPLSESRNSFDLSLLTATGRWSLAFEARQPTDATASPNASPPGPDDLPF